MNGAPSSRPFTLLGSPPFMAGIFIAMTGVGGAIQRRGDATPLAPLGEEKAAPRA